MKRKEQCQIEGCKNPAKYALYKTYPDKGKVWLHVCDQHDQEIAKENLATYKEAVAEAQRILMKQLNKKGM